MYRYIYVYICICNTHKYTHTHTRVYTVCVYTYIHMYVCMYVCTYMEALAQDDLDEQLRHTGLEHLCPKISPPLVRQLTEAFHSNTTR